MAVVSIYRGLLTCEWGPSRSRRGTTERTRPQPMSAHSLCLRTAPVCAPSNWMCFNQTVCCVFFSGRAPFAVANTNLQKQNIMYFFSFYRDQYLCTISPDAVVILRNSLVVKYKMSLLLSSFTALKFISECKCVCFTCLCCVFLSHYSISRPFVSGTQQISPVWWM